MKLYHLANPRNYEFASCGRRGTWGPAKGICPECDASSQKRILPLIIEWEPWSDLVGDFSWPGFNDEVVVSEKVRKALKGNYKGLAFLEIKMYQNPKVKRPTKPSRRTRPRVWLPYVGEKLWDMQATAWCHLDLKKSRVVYKGECSTCSQKLYDTPPFDRRKLFIDTSTWKGEDIFHVREYPAWVFCTERLKAFIERAGFSNVGFELDGQIS